MNFHHTSVREFREGQRVALHPAVDLWMRGCRFGTVVRVRGRYVDVDVDGYGRSRFRPWAIAILPEDE